MKLGQGNEEMIIAPATPAGVSAVAIVRLSGRGVHQLVGRIFRPKKAKKMVYWKLALGHIVDPISGELIDQVLAVLMPPPYTYTGEELAEIHAHGNPELVQAIINLAIREGARLARPGEFSERAFLKGKMDLLQVEALSQLLNKEVAMPGSQVLRELEGNLGKTLDIFIKHLVSLQATLQAALDYPDDVDLPEKAPIEKILAELLALSERLLTEQAAAERLRRGLKVVLIGAPNAGKSTLINALVGSERLLVSEVAGTTRDFVEVPWVVGNYKVLLTDTAGLGEAKDALDAASQERSLEQLKKADIILHLIDATNTASAALTPFPPSVPIITLATKADLPNFKEIEGALAIAAPSGAGLLELEQRVAALVREMAPAASELGRLTSARQASLMAELASECRLAMEALSLPEWGLLVSDELTRVEKILAELTGRAVSEEVLSEIFSHFCLGK